MRSIGVRLAFWYALAATLSSAILFAAGYQLLESRLTHGLDELNQAEFRQLQVRMGADYTNLDPAAIEQRLHELSESGSVLFYISIHVPHSGIKFQSRNLNGHKIPDVHGTHAYTVDMAGIGPVRVNEFFMPPFDVNVATSARQMKDGMREYVRVSLGLLAVMLVASVAIGLGLSRLMLRPLRLIRETATRIGSDNLSERIKVPDVEDEIFDLARLLNGAFDRLEFAFDQIRRFSYEASHELKTPLSLIRLHAEKMLNDGDLSAAHTEAVVVQIEELARLNQIIDELLFLSRADAKAIGLNLSREDPARFLETFSQDAAALAEHGGRAFSFSHEGRGQVDFEEKWIRQVLLNLVTNALNVSPPDGRVTLRSQLAHGTWRVSVEDEGPGLTIEQCERIFERFVRFGLSAPGDRGSGLGLSISRSIIQLHQGRIYAEPIEPGAGLRVTFEVPARARGGVHPARTERRAA
jgi:signal transduction histidine kinase